MNSNKLREVAGKFATGVTVATIHKNETEVVGMTANSFVSISLDPALVGLFVMSEATFLEHLKINSPLAISILSSEQKDISNQFAGLNKKDIEIEYEEDTEYSIIKNALAWYKTKIESIQQIGDHHLIVCSIKELHKDDNKKPLLYYSGYKRINNNL